MSARADRFERLAREVGPRVLAYLVRRTDRAEDAAEVYNDVLTVTWRRFDQVPGEPGAAFGWMLATARRCLANHRRGTARRDDLVQRLARRLPDAIIGGPEHGAELRERVRTLLGALSETDRELLLLIAWEGLQVTQAAEVLGISASAARKRLQRARAAASAADPQR